MAIKTWFYENRTIFVQCKFVYDLSSLFRSNIKFRFINRSILVLWTGTPLVWFGLLILILQNIWNFVWPKMAICKLYRGYGFWPLSSLTLGFIWLLTMVIAWNWNSETINELVVNLKNLLTIYLLKRNIEYIYEATKI